MLYALVLGNLFAVSFLYHNSSKSFRLRLSWIVCRIITSVKHCDDVSER